ncbi:KxYKxGKxW signal peptide domain-containing protein [Companilactobacillus sp. HBUAS59699]|uniref:KxYKxGKxW signal peptide domain-containing protein n=1 Tax=Companilactobacillus sp. HBUAS59699 TaxID=3109358 RepID=UPI002FF41C6B
MRFQQLKKEPNSVLRKKLYKSGKNWVIKATLAFVGGLTLLGFSTLNVVNADDVQSDQSTQPVQQTQKVQTTQENSDSATTTGSSDTMATQNINDADNSSNSSNGQISGSKTKVSAMPASITPDTQQAADSQATYTITYTDANGTPLIYNGAPITTTVTGKVGSNVPVPTLGSLTDESPLGKRVAGYAVSAVNTSNGDGTITIQDGGGNLSVVVPKLDDAQVTVYEHDEAGNNIGSQDGTEVNIPMYGTVDPSTYSFDNFLKNRTLDMYASTVYMKSKDGSYKESPQSFANYTSNHSISATDLKSISQAIISTVSSEINLSPISDYFSDMNWIIDAKYLDVTTSDQDVTYKIQYIGDDGTILYTSDKTFTGKVGSVPSVSTLSDIGEVRVGYAGYSVEPMSRLTDDNNQIYQVKVPSISPRKMIINEVDQSGKVLGQKVLVHQVYANDFDNYTLDDLISDRQFNFDKSTVGVQYGKTLAINGVPISGMFNYDNPDDPYYIDKSSLSSVNLVMDNFVKLMSGEMNPGNNLDSSAGKDYVMNMVFGDAKKMTVGISEKDENGKSLNDGTELDFPINSSVDDYTWNSSVSGREVDWSNANNTMTDSDGNTSSISDIAQKLGIDLTDQTTLGDFISKFVQTTIGGEVNDFANADKGYTFNVVYKAAPSSGGSSSSSSHHNSSESDENTDTNTNTTTKKLQNVATTTKVVNVFDKNGKLVGNRALGINTSWFSDEIHTVDGTEYYRVATGEFAKAADVYVYVGQKGIVQVNSNQMGYLVDYQGHMITNRALKPSSDWITDRYTIINGEKYYRVATNEFINASYVSFI